MEVETTENKGRPSRRRKSTEGSTTRPKSKRTRKTASETGSESSESAVASGPAREVVQVDVGELTAPGAALVEKTRGKTAKAPRGKRTVTRKVAAKPQDESSKPPSLPAVQEAPTVAPPRLQAAPTKPAEPHRGGRRRGRSRGKPPVTQTVEMDDSLDVNGFDEGVALEPRVTADKHRVPEGRGGDRRPQPIDVVDEDVDLDGQDEAGPTGATRRMLINVSGGDECRVAVLSDGRLEELFIERASTLSHVGNIYKGRVTNVEPSIQAVFVDFGLKKDGFLHISDVQPQYFPDHKGPGEEVGRKIPRHLRPPIQRCFRRGQEVIVQVTKEGVGTKGPTLTTYLSIPGRFLVMMPGMQQHGVSRKIEDDAVRRQMRDVMNELTLPGGMGFILRTAGQDRGKRDLQRDLNYLLRLWKTVADRVRNHPAPAELYRESDLVTRAIRDVFTLDFDKIVVDDAETARLAQEFIQVAMPRARTMVELYSAREPLFHRYGIEQEIERINMRHVPLASGGSLVIESTEALVAIDVNSGKFRSVADAEETAFRINMEAADEIARQLRLRDLGGLIICDFIDMRQERHMRAVERKLRDELKKHKERARILRMSAFGIIEMTRQRQGPSLKRNLYDDCPHCKGTGLVKMPESIMLDVIRTIQLATHHGDVQRVTVTVANDVAMQILNGKRALLQQIEADTGKSIVIRGEPSYTRDQLQLGCEDAGGRPVVVPTGQVANSVAKPNPRRVAF